MSTHNATRIPLNTALDQTRGVIGSLTMSTSEIGLSDLTTDRLQEKGLTTVNDLLNCKRQELLSISASDEILVEVYSGLESIGLFRPDSRSESLSDAVGHDVRIRDHLELDLPLVRDNVSSAGRGSSAYTFWFDGEGWILLTASLSSEGLYSGSGSLFLNELPSDSEKWTAEKSERRVELIDKDIQGTISENEKMELMSLMLQMRVHRRETAPLPLKAARELHQQLLKKKRLGEESSSEEA